jgi:hypothetical protein
MATSATLAKCGLTPAFVFVRVLAADGSERRVANGRSFWDRLGLGVS